MPELRAFEFGLVIEELKRHKSPHTIKLKKNWLKQEAGQFVLSSISLLIQFGIRKNCLRSGRTSFYLFIRRVIQQTSNYKGISLLVNYIQNYIPHPFVRSYLHMNRKFMGTISVDFNTIVELLIIYFSFIKYFRKMGIHWSSASAI